ncbi:MAG: hypothetical protein RIT04_497 [Candidatus Parcubacteria bacterium]
MLGLRGHDHEVFTDVAKARGPAFEHELEGLGLLQHDGAGHLLDEFGFRVVHAVERLCKCPHEGVLHDSVAEHEDLDLLAVELAAFFFHQFEKFRSRFNRPEGEVLTEFMLEVAVQRSIAELAEHHVKRIRGIF